MPHRLHTGSAACVVTRAAWRQCHASLACTALPCDATQIGRFRRVLGEAGVEQLLKSTIEASVSMGVVKKTEFERIIVDTTVQEKAIAHPTDSRLLEIARHKVASAAKRCGIALKQTFAKEGRELRRKAGG